MYKFTCNTKNSSKFFLSVTKSDWGFSEKDNPQSKAYIEPNLGKFGWSLTLTIEPLTIMTKILIYPRLNLCFKKLPIDVINEFTILIVFFSFFKRYHIISYFYQGAELI